MKDLRREQVTTSNYGTNINDTGLTRQKWVNEGGIFFPISGDTVLLKTPGRGIFNVVKSPNPMDARLGLQRIADTFEFNFKIYELGCDEMLKTIKKTWESDVFVKGEKNLGVIFNGLKGTGKTLSAKLLCNALDLPVVIVQYPYEGLVNFLQSLCFECIVFIDEAEKTFKKGEMLTLYYEPATGAVREKNANPLILAVGIVFFLVGALAGLSILSVRMVI